MSETVETYSGARLHERPRRFRWRERWYRVTEVLARWQEPEALVFRVKGEDGRLYRLTYHFSQDAWTVQPEK